MLNLKFCRRSLDYHVLLRFSNYRPSTHAGKEKLCVAEFFICSKNFFLLLYDFVQVPIENSWIVLTVETLNWLQPKPLTPFNVFEVF